MRSERSKAGSVRSWLGNPDEGCSGPAAAPEPVRTGRKETWPGNDSLSPASTVWTRHDLVVTTANKEQIGIISGEQVWQVNKYYKTLQCFWNEKSLLHYILKMNNQAHLNFADKWRRHPFLKLINGSVGVQNLDNLQISMWVLFHISVKLNLFI